MKHVHALPGVFRNFAGRLGIIEGYVLKRTLWSVAGALAIIGALILLIDFVEVSRSVGTRAQSSPLQTLGLTLMKSPNVVLQLLPFVFLFGVLAAFVGLNRRSELVAMRAAGVSAWRFIFPAALATFIAGVATILALGPLASYLNDRFERTRTEMLEGYIAAPSPTGEVFLRQGDGRTQIVVRAAEREARTSRLKNVSLWIYSLGEDGRPNFEQRVDAATAELRDGFWRLSQAREASPGRQALTYDRLDIPSTLKPEEAFQRFASPDSVSLWALPSMISQVEGAGFSATAYRLRLHQLLATPMLFAAMSVLGAAFSLRLMRLGGLAMLAVSGVILGFLVFFFNEFCGALGQAEIIPPFLAGWTPPLIALLSAFTLLCYTEDG